NEVVFRGRAGAERVTELLEQLPDLQSAAKCRGRLEGHAAAARKLARIVIRRHEGKVPRDPRALAQLPGMTPATGRLTAALLASGEAPRSTATLRVAQRVAGVEREGSLTGVLQVVLARLARFG